MLPHAGLRAVSRDRRTKHQAPRTTAPPPEQIIPVYLTLRVLSSLDQESVEGKEGRDEEEVTSALLPIWKGKEKHTRERTKPTKNPPGEGLLPHHTTKNWAGGQSSETPQGMTRNND